MSLKSAISAVEIVEYPGPRFAMQLKAEYNERGEEVRDQTPPLQGRAQDPLVHRVLPADLQHPTWLQGGAPQVYEHVRDLEEVGFLVWVRKGRSKLYSTTPEFAEYFGLSTDVPTMKHQLERRTMILR